jgi:hypothetical protein
MNSMKEEATAVKDAAKKTFSRCGSLIVKNVTLFPRSSIARSGPVPALISKGRWALPVWVLLVASANAKAIVDLGFYHNFATRSLGLTGLKDSSLRGLVARVVRQLVEMKLVEVVEANHGHNLVRLLDLDGKGKPYTMPRRTETKVVYVPTGDLFGNGWLRDRTDGRGLNHVELGALLITLTEESWQYNKYGPHEWEKSRGAISRDYGIAASTWSEGKAGLLAKGLLHWDMPGLVQGSRRVRIPADRYTVDVTPLTGLPEDAPQYRGVPLPVTVRSKATGRKLRLYRQWRLEVKPTEPKEAATGKVLTIPTTVKTRRGA